MAQGFGDSSIPPAINQTAKKYIRGMKKGKKRWNRLYGKRDIEVMHKTANKMAMKEMSKMPPTYNDVFGGNSDEQLQEKAKSKAQQRFMGLVRRAQKTGEASSPEVAKAASSMSKSDVKDYASTKHKGLPEKKRVEEGNKSGDSSLRDWFGKSKSSDGKPGWVQLGGKYAGKPCARQPGQTTKPKCGSSKMKRNLNKDEEEAAFRRKQKEDPNPNRKGKAINVKTEDLDLQKMSKELDGASKMHKGQSERIKKHLKKMKKDIHERGDFWHPDPDKDRKLGGPGANQRAREDRAAASKPKSDPKKLRPGESYMQYAKRMKTRKEDCWDGYEKKGMKTMFGKKYPNCVKKTKKEETEHVAEADSLAAMQARREKRLAAQRKREGTTASGRDFGHDYSLSDKQQKARRDAEFKAGLEQRKTKKEEVEVQEGMGDIAIKAIEKTNPPYLSKRSSIIRGIKSKQLDSYLKKVDKKKAERAAKKNEELEFAGELMTEEQFDEAAGEKDACYKKVKARYSVWPSAYASGALVKCRKVGAANWGNKSKK